MAEGNTHAYYLRDLGYLLREAAEEAKRLANAPDAENRDWQQGRKFAYMEVVSLMQQQANVFGLPLSDLALEGLDPENDLL